MRLTKTDFILYRDCPSNVWVKANKPDEYKKFSVSEFEQSLAEMGNEVEFLARGMFPSGYLIEKRSEGAQALTQKLIAERTPVIFQAVFETDKFLSAADVLVWNNIVGTYDIYEIKMSSTEDEDEEGEMDENGEAKPKKVNRKKELQYEYDLAFQSIVAEKCGVKFNKKYLVRLNKRYVRRGELDFTPGQLFIIEDKTEKINALQAEALHEMGLAHNYLLRTEPERPCSCFYKRGRNGHCTTFSYLNPEVPEYGVHDLNRIGSSPKLLKALIDEGALTLDQISLDDERLLPSKSRDPLKPSKPRKYNQVKVYKTQSPIIDTEALKQELDSLELPLYFLDYETYPTAIPPFDGYRPYQHIVFQYSLHVLRDKNSTLEHYECLELEGDPAPRIIAGLRKHIGEKGNLISWYKKFENSRNKELAKFSPADAEFLNDLIRRTYDLMDIVENQYVVYPDFKGRSSIKAVLPALIKDLSYKKLAIKSGTEAIEAYRQITTGELKGEEVEKKRKEMLEYCELDTFAMYRLWQFFGGLLG